MQDQVLYLKHNLNAKALDVLKTEIGSIEADVISLIESIETSLRESERFTDSLS